MAEYFNDFSFGVHSAFRVACQFDDDFMAFRSAVIGMFRNKNITRDFLIIRDDKAEAFRFCVCAHDAVDASFQDADVLGQNPQLVQMI